MSNRYSYLIILLFLLARWSSDAQVISMEDVLATATTDQLISRYQSIRDLAGDLKMHDP